MDRIYHEYRYYVHGSMQLSELMLPSTQLKAKAKWFKANGWSQMVKYLVKTQYERQVLM